MDGRDDEDSSGGRASRWQELTLVIAAQAFGCRLLGINEFIHGTAHGRSLQTALP
jgi:hypothetical protein